MLTVMQRLVLASACLMWTPSLCRANDADDTEKPLSQIQLKVQLTEAADGKTPKSVELLFQNLGRQDKTLNLGMMLANGKHMLPDALRLEIRKSGAPPLELHFSDRRFPGISGRVDDFLVPLRAGSTYSIRVKLKNFWAPKSKLGDWSFEKGAYEMRAFLTGKKPQFINADTEGIALQRVWKGEIRSEPVSFEVR